MTLRRSSPRVLLGALLAVAATTVAVADVVPPRLYVEKKQSPEALEVAALQAGKAPLGLAFEKPRAVAVTALADRHTEDAPEDIFVLRALSWGGVTAERTRVRFDRRGVLFVVQTTVHATGAAATAKVMKLDEELCKKFGPIERTTAAPPTPRPGDPPAPTVTDFNCHGYAGSLNLNLIEHRTVTATTDQVTVELSLARVPPG